jgi:exodeoxyribonuclease-3
MRIVTLNVNGIRSAARKGLFDWLPQQAPDVVCLQEVRAQPEQIADELYHPAGFHCYYETAQRKGYSGVALYSRREPDELRRGFGSAEFDAEGRYLEARFGDLSVISVYLPSGSASPERQQAKFRFLDEFSVHLDRLRRDGRQYLLCGDWNIAHREIDLKQLARNQKNSGFLPEERALAGPSCSARAASSTASGEVSPASRTSTPGGPTVARPGRRTSAGASITRSGVPD